MRSAALSILLLGAAALFASVAQAQIMLPDRSPTKGQEASLDTSCGAWTKNRKTMNYYLMMYVAENHLRTSVESIQDKQGIGGDPLKNVEEKDIASWMDKFCGEKPDSSMQVAAEGYAKVLVEQMPASAKNEPRGGATAAAAAAGTATGAAAGGAAAPAEKKSIWSFKVARTCQSWVGGRKGLDYYMMMNSSEEYLKGRVEELRQARGVTRDPLQGVSDKDIAKQLDEYCPGNLTQPLESVLDAYADRLVGGSPVAQPAAGGAEKPRATAQAPVGGQAPAGAAAAATPPAPRQPSAFSVGRSCDSWNTGRKSLDYYLLMSKSEDYLKAEAAALAAERGVAKDPLAGVGSKEIAAWLDQYCAQRGKEPLESALNAYANELVGGSPPQSKAEARGGEKPRTVAEAPAKGEAAAAGAAGAAGPAPRQPSAFSVGRSCNSWNSGRKGLDYYLLISKAEDYLKAEAGALAAERGITRDPMQGVDSKQIAAWLDQYCATRGPEQLEVALNAYANELVGPAPGQPKAEVRPSAATPAPASPPKQAAAKPQAPAAPAAAQGPREPAYLSGGRNCAAWTAGRKGQEYYNLIEGSEAQLRSDVRTLRETRGLSFDPLETVSRKDISTFLDGYCAERPKAPLESAVRIYANQLLSGAK
ncbi:MAG TPA: hypothetical protein VF104_01350 [Burkholderiales bacterium]